MWDYVGMSRGESGLQKAIVEIQYLKEDFYKNLYINGSGNELNQALEKAGRVADLLELGELMANDALLREESCGGHFRVEHQTEENEAKRNDKDFSHVSAWEYKGSDQLPSCHKEPLNFEYVKLSQRSYK